MSADADGAGAGGLLTSGAATRERAPQARGTPVATAASRAGAAADGADLPPYTIAVLNFNGIEVLEPTLDALRRIARDENVHVMVLDNGSTDGSPDWVRDHYPEFPVHLTADDGNLPRVRNYALQHTPTRYMMLCDNDLILDPECPPRLLAAMRAHPDVLACTPRMVYVEKPEVIHNDVGRVHFLAVSGRSERGLTVREAPPSDAPVPTVPGGIAMIDRELATRIGLFDDVYPFGWGCDAEFYVRGTIAGLHSLHVSSALTYHPVPAHGFARAAGQIHNRYRFILTMYSGRALLLLAPPLLLFEAALTVLFAVKGLTGTQARSIARIWRGRRELLATRRRIQASRRAPDTAYLDASGFSGGGPLSGGGLSSIGGLGNAVLRAYWAIVARLL